MQAELERRAVEPEDVEPTPQRGEAAVGNALATVRPEAPFDDVELAGELGGRAVCVRPETLPDGGQAPTVGLGRVAVGRQVDGPDGGVGFDEGRRDPPRGRERTARAIARKKREGTYEGTL